MPLPGFCAQSSAKPELHILPSSFSTQRLFWPSRHVSGQMMDRGLNHRYPPGFLGNYGQPICDFISAITKWDWYYFALCRDVLRTDSKLIFEACSVTVNGRESRCRWAKYVPRQSEILLLTFAEIVSKSIFSDTSSCTGMHLIKYLCLIYFYIFICIYRKKILCSVNWISYPFSSEVCAARCIEGRYKLCSCSEVTKICMTRGVCCSILTVSTSWRLLWIHASHLEFRHSSHNDVTGSRAVAMIKDRLLTQFLSAGLGKSAWAAKTSILPWVSLAWPEEVWWSSATAIRQQSDPNCFTSCQPVSRADLPSPVYRRFR